MSSPGRLQNTGIVSCMCNRGCEVVAAITKHTRWVLEHQNGASAGRECRDYAENVRGYREDEDYPPPAQLCR